MSSYAAPSCLPFILILGGLHIQIVVAVAVARHSARDRFLSPLCTLSTWVKLSDQRQDTWNGNVQRMFGQVMPTMLLFLQRSAPKVLDSAISDLNSGCF